MKTQEAPLGLRCRLRKAGVITRDAVARPVWTAGDVGPGPLFREDVEATARSGHHPLGLPSGSTASIQDTPWKRTRRTWTTGAARRKWSGNRPRGLASMGQWLQ